MKKLLSVFAAITLIVSFSANAAVCVPPRDANGKIARSSKEVAAFKRTHPCPATGKRYGACGGYVIDHIVPLCACGPDKVSNMQWQTVKDAKAKDKLELKLCGKAA